MSDTTYNISQSDGFERGMGKTQHMLEEALAAVGGDGEVVIVDSDAAGRFDCSRLSTRFAKLAADRGHAVSTATGGNRIIVDGHFVYFTASRFADVFMRGRRCRDFWDHSAKGEE